MQGPIQYVFKEGEPVAGPFTNDSDAWDAQREQLEQVGPDEWDTIRRASEWFVSERYDDGTVYLTSRVKGVTAFLENNRDGSWNAGLFDDREYPAPVIDESAVYDVDLPAALVQLLDVTGNADAYRETEVSET